MLFMYMRKALKNNRSKRRIYKDLSGSICNSTHTNPYSATVFSGRMLSGIYIYLK